MGVSINAQSNADSEYVQAVKTISMVLHKRMFNILYRFDLTYMLTPLARAEKKALNVLHQFTEKIIVQRREELIREGSSQESSNDDADVGAKRKMAFLDILLQSTVDERPLSNLDIREEVDTFMFEGHDTTSSAIAFALSLLSKNPDVQQRAFEEASELEGREKESMPYLEAVIKETLRIYPSVPFFSRKVLEDLEVGKLTVPKGASISCLIYMLHRDPKNFPDPERFDPDRFLVNEKQMHPFAFAAFSAGPRNCIGKII